MIGNLKGVLFTVQSMRAVSVFLEYKIKSFTGVFKEVRPTGSGGEEKCCPTTGLK